MQYGNSPWTYCQGQTFCSELTAEEATAHRRTRPRGGRRARCWGGAIATTRARPLRRDARHAAESPVADGGRRRRGRRRPAPTYFVSAFLAALAALRSALRF